MRWSKQQASRRNRSGGGNKSCICRLGYELRRDAVHWSGIESLRAEFNSAKPGARLFSVSGAVGALANGSLSSIAKEFIGLQARPVRLILFDKLVDANWNLGWRQDRVIAVGEKVEIDGFNNWSRKHGALHVEPPFDYIKRMITIRFHCDDCNSENGALEVVPGSHRLGRLTDAETDALTKDASGKILECSAGDIIILSTSIVHRSRPSTSPRHRRVIHVDYCGETLPPPLRWAFSLEAVA